MVTFFAACCFMLAAVPASGHMSLIVPPSRNAIDKSLAPWANGTFGPAPGETDKYGCNCVNASAPCEVAQSCFWFSGNIRLPQPSRLVPPSGSGFCLLYAPPPNMYSQVVAESAAKSAMERAPIRARMIAATAA